MPAEAAPEAPSDSTGDQEPLVSDERTAIPDYVLSPNMEPVETINGIDFIGVLTSGERLVVKVVLQCRNYDSGTLGPVRFEIR